MPKQSYLESSEILWNPTEEFKNKSNLNAYITWLKSERGLTFSDYDSVWRWSVENVDAFWSSLLDYFDIIKYAECKSIRSDDQMPGVKWFEGLQLNYTQHLFRYKNTTSDAIIFINETGKKNISWTELEMQVSRFRNYLISKGIGKGDRVAAFLPNIPEAIIAFMAVNSLGAVWSCCSPDFGVDTVVERFGQIEPRLLIGVDGYQYNGKPYNKLEVLSKIIESLPSLENAVLCSYLDKDSKMDGVDSWSTIQDEKSSIRPLEFQAVDFNDPIWILYSSGTTGKPKAITHSHGGMLLEHLKYMHFHNDVKPGENFFWFTTTGWMMWNFLQASLLAGATPVLFDGSPGYPSLEVLWKWTEALPIHHFGTSAPYLVACMKKDLDIINKYNTSQLRSIGSTGAPLPPEAFKWIYENISSNIWLCSMSGGTDVCTAFVGGNPMAPVIEGHIQSRALGCALYAYNDEGSRVLNQLGEMVVEEPMPCMPIYFWNDQNNERYKSSYFEKFEGKWCHGDWIKIYDDGSLTIHGRSDATLNRKGIRIGTAEIYAVLDHIDAIEDSIVINLERENKDDIMPLFVVLKSGYELVEDLEYKIKTALRKKCSPRHVPDVILPVKEVPYTLSGKKMEVPLKKMFMGLDISNVLNKDAMRNPDCFEEYSSFIKDLT